MNEIITLTVWQLCVLGFMGGVASSLTISAIDAIRRWKKPLVRPIVKHEINLNTYLVGKNGVEEVASQYEHKIIRDVEQP